MKVITIAIFYGASVAKVDVYTGKIAIINPN